MFIKKTFILFFYLIITGALMKADSNNEKLSFLDINGIKVPVISEYSAVIPSGNIQLIFIGAGSMFNAKDLPIAKLSSLILNYGTKKLGSVGFANLLDSKAIDISASVGATTLNISASFLKEQKDFAIARLQDLLYDPNVTQKSLDTNKDMMISAFMANSVDFDYIANVNLKKTIFKNTPLQYPSIGKDKQSIQSVQLNDIKKYLKDNLVLNKLVIVLGGDIDINKTLNELKMALSKLNVGIKKDIPFYAIKPSKDIVTYKDTKQSYIYFASPIKINNLLQDDYKVKVATFILGSSGFGSRLMEEIRVKRGLAYSIYARAILDRSNHYLTGYMQTSLDKQQEAIKAIKEIYSDFVAKGVTQSELQDAKEFILGSKVLGEEKLNSRLSSAFSNYYNQLPLNYKDEFLKNVENLDLKTLNDFIKSHKEILEMTFSIVTKK